MLLISTVTISFAQDLSVFEIVDNESVGLTVAPFEKAGMCLIDIDNNGWIDVYSLRYKSPGYSRIYVNSQGHFEDITDQSPLKQIENDGSEDRIFTVVLSGIYICLMKVNNFSQSKKIVFV
jgi:hypothetical protein